MPPTTTGYARLDSAASHVFALPELWALIAHHGDSVVGAWRLMRVCKAARLGAREWLETLPGVVVCGGYDDGGHVRDVWRLDLATMRWERMPSLLVERDEHACCAVRGRIVVLGGETSGDELLSSVEMLHFSAGEEEGDGGAFVNLPPLSCGSIHFASGITVEESHSAAGQVLLLGGVVARSPTSDVRLVDLATGTCTPQPSMLHGRYCFAAGQLKDGRVVCVGGGIYEASEVSAEVYGPPAQGAPDAPWMWTELPAMSVRRYGFCGCVMSGGRFAVLGGYNLSGGGTTSVFRDPVTTSSCEALELVGDTDAHWVPLPSMHQPRSCFACAAVAGSIIVVGGSGTKSAEVYDEVLDRWFRLPRDLPHNGTSVTWMGCALQ